MRQLFFAGLFLCAALVCYQGEINIPVTPNKPAIPVYNIERPIVNPPLALRKSNWIGRQNEGSCVHATMISLFWWQHRDNLATRWSTKYDSGESPQGLASKFDKEGVRYAYTVGGDVAFLEWACKTRRGCGITVMGGLHMVALVHLDDKWACILDNNNVAQYKWIPRESLISEWKNSNGWSVAILYTPTAPLPL